MSAPVFVRGIPAPQGSKNAFRHSKTNKVVVVESSKAVGPWREAVAWQSRQLGRHTGPVLVHVKFVMPRPKSHYGTGKNAGQLKPNAPTHCDVKPDIDKLLRSTYDGLTTAGALEDDARIVGGSQEKRYVRQNELPGAWITITPADETIRP